MTPELIFHEQNKFKYTYYWGRQHPRYYALYSWEISSSIHHSVHQNTPRNLDLQQSTITS